MNNFLEVRGIWVGRAGFGIQ